jgi:2,5-furandicarboxylate decarboxylase 1
MTSMTDAVLAQSPASEAARRPITRLRDWLDHLAGHGRLAVARPGAALDFEVAAIAKRLDGTKATLFPSPSRHPVPVVSGLISDRGWMADAMGVPAGKVIERFQSAALSPIPWRQVKSAPAQEIVHRNVELKRLMPIPTP